MDWRVFRCIPVIVALTLTPRDAVAQPGPQAAAGPVAAVPGVQEQPAAARDESPPLYDEQADAREQIAGALERARTEHKRVLIQWGANWCVWCKRLHHLVETDRELGRKLQYEYELVLADIGEWDKNIELALSYGADVKRFGVPFLTILDAEGETLANQETGVLETEVVGQVGHDPAKVIAFLTEHQSPYPEAQALLEGALEQARDSGRRVFLHFGAPWCGWCRRLESWMARPDVQPRLAEDFVDLKIDVDRTLGGNELLADLRGSPSGGIPWIALLDSDGKPLADSNGPDGNIGFPMTAAEVAHFGSMLRRACSRLEAGDIGALVETLQAGDS